MNAYWGSGAKDPHILFLGIRWKRTLSITLRPLKSQGNSPGYPLDRKLDGIQIRSVCCGEEKSFGCARNRTPVVQSAGISFSGLSITFDEFNFKDCTELHYFWAETLNF